MSLNNFTFVTDVTFDNSTGVLSQTKRTITVDGEGHIVDFGEEITTTIDATITTATDELPIAEPA
jgi:hypothetical protein